MGAVPLCAATARLLPRVLEVGTWELTCLGELASAQEGFAAQGMTGVCLSGKHRSFIVFQFVYGVFNLFFSNI